MKKGKRAKIKRKMKYETDLTDDQWNCIKGLIHEQKTGEESRAQFLREES